MEADRLVFMMFKIAGAVLLFICAVAIFLNIVGFTVTGGEVKKTADVSMCRLAANNCANQRMMGGSDCEDVCLPCIEVSEWHQKCLKGDLSLFT
jgi:hypothetical protein